MSDKALSATIVVATHKKYRMPKDPLYLPVHVGAEGKKDAKGNPLDFGYQKDNEGDNISIKNPRYCELTGIYWAWKNLDSDYIGLVHYRRYFGGRNRGKDIFDSILTGKELQPMLGKYEVFVPRERRYMIETLYSSFSEVPDRDYRVIRACFMVEDLFARYPNIKKEKSASFIFEAIKTVLLNIRTLKFKEWLRGIFYSGRYFVVTMSYVIFFPRTRKKYGFKFRFKR